jgi:hypothetical protein
VSGIEDGNLTVKDDGLWHIYAQVLEFQLLLVCTSLYFKFGPSFSLILGDHAKMANTMPRWQTQENLRINILYFEGHNPWHTR